MDGMLCGFDRLVIRGEWRALYIGNGGGIEQYLRSSHVMFRDLRSHVLQGCLELRDGFGEPIQFEIRQSKIQVQAGMAGSSASAAR
jgi:hypothetical protein